MPDTPARPNILWICTDQQRFDTLGSTGNSWVHTPHLDRLAAEGVQFTHAFCQNPVCTPSRASFLTGRYPRTNRCRQNGQSLPPEEAPNLVPRLLADSGYLCGLSGKLHISAANPKQFPTGERRRNDGYQVFDWSHHPGDDGNGNQYALWLAERGTRYSTKRHPDSPHVRLGMPEELHQTTWCIDRAERFVRTAAHHDLPWLYSVNIFDPHHPFDPPEKYLERYLDRLDEIPLPEYTEGELESKPVWQRIDHDGAYGGIAMACSGMKENNHRLVRAAYWAMGDLIDAQVGRILSVLEETGQRENTIVLFTSDHGEMLGDHGIYLKGPYFYEPAVRVPLILSWPEHWPARRTETLVELVDLAPTLLEAAGVPIPPAMQGKSLLPLLTGERAIHRSNVYCEFLGSNFNYVPPANATMLRTNRYKFVKCHGAQDGELYDLQLDPTETDNLWNDPDHASIKSALGLQLLDRIALTADPLPPREAVW